MRRQFITRRPQFTTAHPTPLTDRHGQFTGVTTTACATIVTAAVAIEGRDERCGLLDWHGATAPFASPFAATSHCRKDTFTHPALSRGRTQ